MYEGYLFDRTASVSIGKPGEEGRIFKDVRIKFKITRNNQSSANQSTIELYNLNKDSRGFIEGEGLICILKAGYNGIDRTGETLDTIFTGDILDFSHEQSGTDIITKLSCGDTQKKLVETHAEQTFKAGTKLKQVVHFLIDKLGVSIGSEKNLGETEFEYGIAVEGNVKTALDTLLKPLGITWHTQDGEVYIEDEVTKDETKAIILSKETGLVGTPIVKKDGEIELISLIQPAIKPGKTIKLESKEKTGFFKVLNADYEGDTHESIWQARIIVK